MGLTSSLNTAIAGLHATQIGIGVVSQNVANAGTAGYVRRTVSTTEANSGSVVGVASTQVQRLLDQIVQRQLWQESAGAAYATTRAEAFTTLDQLFGAPGSDNAFDAVYSAFTNSLQALENDPSSYSNRTAVLDAAKELAGRLNALSDGIQQLRSQAESGISNAVTDVNRLLGNLASLNQKVVQAGRGDAAAALRDERDRVLSDLSQYVDIRTTENDQGSLSVFTSSGVQIFDGRPSVTFSFDQHSSLSAASEWTAAAATRGVGTISIRDGSGNTIDAIGNKTFRSGEIAAFIELRDTSLVQAQAQIDEIAAHLASALSDRTIAGVVTGTGAANSVNLNADLTSPVFSRGNSVTFDYQATAGGATQRLTLVNVSAGTTLPASATGDANNRVIAVDLSGGPAASAAAIQLAIDGALGAGAFTVTNPAGNQIAIAAGATRQVVALTAHPTATALTGSPELPFFVDGGRGNAAYTGSFEGAQQFTGFAGRIAVNPLLVADRSQLVVYNTSPATPQGDSTRPALLLERLNSTLASFTRTVGVDGSTATTATTVSNYIQRVVASQGQSIEAAKRLDEGQKIALSAVQGRFNETAKVSVDQEMSLLIELQSAYAANARIVSTVKEMMDVLLRI